VMRTRHGVVRALVLVCCAAVTAAGSALQAAAPAARVTPPPQTVVEAFGLDPFYTKYASAGGVPIVASGKVNDFALLEAAYLVKRMLADRPDIVAALVENKVRVVVMATAEFTTDVPDHSDLDPPAFWDRRARGLGATPARPATSCGEENLLHYPGDPYDTESILVHEFAHTIHHMGLNTIDKTFDRRLNETYRKAMAKGLWKGKYASRNRAEYWAEAVQSWFDTNRPPDHDHNHVDTREELKAYDPGIAKLVEEVFGDKPWRYRRPEDRTEPGHLKGYAPAKALTFVWPDRVVKAFEAHQKPKRIDHKPQTVEGWTVQVDVRLVGSAKDVGGPALKILAAKLYEISLVVPEAALAKLREAPIWIDLDHRLGGMQYHPSAKWLKGHGHDPAMAKAVHIPNARNFLKMWRRNKQPSVVLHELAHAYHDRVLGFDDPKIRAAYDRAVKAGCYESVLHIYGKMTRHYALTDHKEYFAESTEAFFGTNDFYPFVRAELKQHDPGMYELLEEVWGTNPKRR
jgi:hypothetical protein